MSAPRDYESIPGTYVYDAERGRVGYHLNMFCMSLNDPENRKAFKAGESAYLDRFPLTPEQKEAVLKRDWLGMLKVGGNIYYTIKIAFCDGLTFQDVASDRFAELCIICCEIEQIVLDLKGDTDMVCE